MGATQVLLLTGYAVTALAAGLLAGVGGQEPLPLSTPVTDAGHLVGRQLRPAVVVFAVAAMLVAAFLALPV